MVDVAKLGEFLRLYIKGFILHTNISNVISDNKCMTIVSPMNDDYK